MNHALPLDQSTLAAATDKINVAMSERALLVQEIETAQADADVAAGEAYIAGRAPPSTALLQKLRDRLRGIDSALLLLTAERDRAEAKHTSETVAILEAEAVALVASRRQSYMAGIALLSVAHRVLAFSVGAPGAGYPINPRTAQAGIKKSDWPQMGFSRLSEIASQLEALGLDKRETARISGLDPQVWLGNADKVESEGRCLIQEIESLLKKEGITGDLPPLCAIESLLKKEGITGDLPPPSVNEKIIPPGFNPSPEGGAGVRVSCQ